MKKKPIVLTLVLLCLLTFGFSSGTLSRYIEEMEGKPIHVTIDGRTYEEKNITSADTDAYSISESTGELTINQYFFQNGKWYVTTGLGTDAFKGNEDIKSFEIPAFITTIGEYALSCPNLTETKLTVASGNEQFKIGNDGDLYSADGTTLYRHFDTDAVWYNAGSLKVIPGAFSYCDYAAIVANSYDSKAWGASNAIILNINSLRDTNMDAIGVSKIEVSNLTYTVTLTGTPYGGKVIYHSDTDPAHSDTHTITNKELGITDSTVSFTVDSIACSDHGNHTEVWLSSYERYAYAYLNGSTLEIHNCYIVLTDDGVLHQYENYSTHAHTHIEAEDVTNLVRSLPSEATVSNSIRWVGDSWSTLTIDKITGVKVVDTMNNPSRTTEWFSGMSSAVWMDLTNLKATVDSTAFGNNDALKVIFYKETNISDAPWGTSALAVNNPESLSLGYVSASADGMTLSVAGKSAVLLTKAVAAEDGTTANKYLLLETDSNAQFTIPSTFATAGEVITVSTQEISQYTYAVLEDDPVAGTKTALSIRNRPAALVENNTKLVDRKDTYPLSENGEVYALPYQQGEYNTQLSTERIAAGNVPEGAIENGWSTIHNDSSGNIEQTATSVAFDDVVYLQGKLDMLFQQWPNVTSIDLTNADLTKVTSVFKMFDTCSKLTNIKFAKNVNTAQVTSMRNMFYELAALTSLNVGGFNTSNVTNMNGMFYKLPLVSALDVSGFDTSNVRDMGGMFFYCGTVTELNVSNFDTDNVTSMSSMFWYCNSLENLDVSNFNTFNVTSMSQMFGHCLALTELDVSNFDTANVTNMSGMFQELTNLTSLDLTTFNTAKVTDMSNMFYASTNLTEIKWEFGEDKFTTANVTNMSGMFNNCYALLSLDVSGFDTQKVTNMGSMFRNCQNLTQLNVSSFNTQKVKDMASMFFSCKKLTVLDLSSFDTSSVTTMGWMFGDCKELVTIYVSDQFVTGQVTSDGNMFGNEGNYSSSKIKGGNGTSFSSSYTDKTYACVDGMNGQSGYFTAVVQPKMDDAAAVVWSFNGTGNYTEGKASTLLLTSTSEDGTLPGYVYLISSVEDVDPVFAEVTNGVFTIPAEMMVEYSSFTIVPAELYTYAVLETSTTTLSTADDADSTEETVTTNHLSIRSRPAAILDGAKVGKDTGTNYLVDSAGIYEIGGSGVVYALPTKDGDYIAKNATAPTGARTDGWDAVRDGGNAAFEQTITSISFDNTIELQGNLRALFYHFTSLQTVDLRNADFSEVTSLWEFFDGCSSLQTVLFDNENIDTSNVTNMAKMFNLCTALTTLDLSGFDTRENTSMNGLFYGCKALTSLDLSGFTNPKVTDMTNMFNGCIGLQSLTLSDFGTSAVTSMSAMFNDCNQLTSLDLSSFDTSNVTNMSSMFRLCKSLTSIVFGSNFNTSNVSEMGQMFAACSSLGTLDVSQFNTSNVVNMGSMFQFCSGLTTLDLSNFNTSKVNNMGSMFWNCSRLTTLTFGKNFDTSAVTNMSGMFKSCNNLTTIYVSDGFVVTEGTTTSDMFLTCNNLKGGNGTTYSVAAVTDGTYARIDGAGGQPGYFTGIVQPKMDDAADMTWSFNGTDNFNVWQDSSLVLTAANEAELPTQVILSGNGYTETVDVIESIIVIPAKFMVGRTSFTISAVDPDDITIDMGSLAWAFANETQTSLIRNAENTLVLLDWVKPEKLIVTIDSTEYTVPNDGTSGITYDPISGSLILPASLITNDTQSVTVAPYTEDSIITLDYTNIDESHLYWGTDGEPVVGKDYLIHFEAHPGYVLADSFTVTIGETTYEVKTDGSSNTEGQPAFDPATGDLTIPAALLTDTTTSVAVSATAERSFAVDVTIDGVTAEYAAGPVDGQPYAITLMGDTFPAAVSVQIDGTAATSMAYDSTTGIITINDDLSAVSKVTIAASEVTPVTCNCTTQCTTENTNTECTVCAEGGPCLGGTGNEEDPDTDPVLDEGGDENAGDDNATEGDDPEDADATDPVPDSDEGEPETPVITVTSNIVGLTFTPDATPAANQDYTGTLTPNDGYTLPETITVTIGADRYMVNLCGENEDGKPDFEGGKLIIPGTLLTGETTITIEAAGVAVPADEDSSGEETQTPDGADNSDEETQPSDDADNSDEETQPSDDADNSDEETQPMADEDISSEETQPTADEDISSESQQPTGTPTEDDSPVEE